MQQAMQLYPDLVLPAVRVAMAMPPTQVSVERLFSVLKLIKTDMRSRLKGDLLHAILFLRTNGVDS